MTLRGRLSSECEVIAIGSGPVADGCARGGRPVGSPRASAGTGACPEPAADEAGGRDRAARRSRSRSIRGSPSARCRTGCATTSGATRKPARAGRAAARGQRRLGARGRRPARPRPLRRAHGVQRHEALPEAGHHLVPAVDRHAVRRARQRQHQLRRDRLPAADPDRRRRRSSIASFLVLEDWATGVTFDADEIDKERGVVLEEWRLGLGADARMLREADAGAAQGIALRRAPADRHARQHPHLRARAPEAVLPRLVPARPDGGDRRRRLRQGRGRGADQDALRARSRRRRRRKPRPRFDVPEHPGTRFTIATDPEATVTVVNVSSAIAARDQTTIGAYRQQTAERVVSGLLSARLGELSQKPDAPFLAAGTNRSLFVSAAEMTSMTAVVPDAGIEKGLAALFAEADRMTKFGITETELDRYKQATVRAYERLAAQTRRAPVGRRSPTSTSATSCSRSRSPASPTSWRWSSASCRRSRWPRSTRSPRPGCRIATAWSRSARRRRRAWRSPTRRSSSAIISGGSGSGLTAYVDTVTSRPLLERPPTPGRIVKTEERAALRDHRVDAVERRPRGDQADDVQPRSDPVPRLQPGRHVAGARHRLHRRRHRQPGHLAGRPGRLDADRSRQEAGRPHRVGPSRHRRDAGRPHRRQRQGRSRDAVPADLPDGGRAARRPRRLPRHGDAAAGDAGESQRRARGGVQRRGQRRR